ncbi:MAG: leucine-rich repeat domain-containing protein [Bacteroidales bacterium]|nr:leucine-rich repeat domain-containing protein [Bacteroidales bacterium]
MKKNLLSLIFIVFTINLWANGVRIEGIYYLLDSETKTAEVTYTDNKNAYRGSIVIPEKVTYTGTVYDVTKIGAYAFQGCSRITSITFPNSLLDIGNDAFYGCENLQKVVVPNIGSWCKVSFKDNPFGYVRFFNMEEGIAEMGYARLYSDENTEIINLEIPESVTSISNYAFSNCISLQSVSIPNSVTTIGNYAFSSCKNLQSIAIPNGVTTIGNYAFSGCMSLQSVSIPHSVKSVETVFNGCDSLFNVTLNSDAIAGSNHIYMKDIFGKHVKEFTLGDSVTRIGNYFFSVCTEMTSCTIGNNVTTIGEFAFVGCSSLDSIIIPNSVIDLGQRTFEGCSGLKSIYLGSNADNRENFYSSVYSAFATNGLTSLESIVVAEDNPIYDSRNNCNAIIHTESNSLILGCQNTVIPDNVIRIENDAFCDRIGLSSMSIPNNVISIGTLTFWRCI